VTTVEIQEPKEWVRSAVSGDLGFLIQKDGVTFVRLDRPQQNVDRIYREQDWVKESSPKWLSLHQRASVAYAADCKLRDVLGSRDPGRKDWSLLSHEERAQWMNGPKVSGIRRWVWEAIMEATLEG